MPILYLYIKRARQVELATKRDAQASRHTKFGAFKIRNGDKSIAKFTYIYICGGDHIYKRNVSSQSVEIVALCTTIYNLHESWSRVRNRFLMRLTDP